jgi:hypothetical protein
MNFRPLNDAERTELMTALRGNAEGNRTILTDRRDTSFLGTAKDVTDDEVISAIKSVPCHYLSRRTRRPNGTPIAAASSVNANSSAD